MHNNGLYIPCDIQRGQSTGETVGDAAWQRHAHAPALELRSVEQRRVERVGLVENVDAARGGVGAHADERQTFNQNEARTQGCQDIRNNYG